MQYTSAYKLTGGIRNKNGDNIASHQNCTSGGFFFTEITETLVSSYKGVITYYVSEQTNQSVSLHSKNKKCWTSNVTKPWGSFFGLMHLFINLSLATYIGFFYCRYWKIDRTEIYNFLDCFSVVSLQEHGPGDSRWYQHQLQLCLHCAPSCSYSLLLETN